MSPSQKYLDHPARAVRRPRHGTLGKLEELRGTQARAPTLRNHAISLRRFRQHD